jgi:hypothetical protein
MKLFFILVILSLSAVSNSEITESRCSLRGKKITETASQIVNNIENHDLPEAYLNQIEFEGQFTSEGQKYSGVIEGFYRPLKDEQFSILPTAIAAVELKRNDHLIYVCGEVDETSAFKLEIYFLGKTTHNSDVKDFINQLTTKDEIRVVPLQLSILNLGLNGKPNTVKNIIKLFILPYYLQAKIFSGFANIFSIISGVNVERVILTDKNLQIAGGIDLDHPDQPRFSKTIDLNSPEAKTLTDVNSLK